MSVGTEFEFRIFGLRRSGNHMVIGSIVSCFDDKEVFFLNDVLTPKNVLAYQRRGTSRCGIGSEDTEYMNNLASKLVSRSSYNPQSFRCWRKCLIQSYEDVNLKIIKEIETQKIGTSQRVCNVLIIRDPYNWLASRIQFKRRKVREFKVDKQITELWKQYAREYLGETNILGDRKVCINYNLFVSDKKYQKEVCDKLGLPFEKMSFDHKLNFGAGSSFTGLKKEENRNYHQRWKRFANDGLFKSLTADPELIELSERIFGPT